MLRVRRRRLSNCQHSVWHCAVPIASEAIGSKQGAAALLRCQPFAPRMHNHMAAPHTAGLTAHHSLSQAPPFAIASSHLRHGSVFCLVASTVPPPLWAVFACVQVLSIYATVHAVCMACVCMAFCVAYAFMLSSTFSFHTCNLNSCRCSGQVLVSL